MLMASITVRKLDDKVKQALRTKAAERGHSLEQEVREILSREAAQSGNSHLGLGEIIRRRFAPLGGVELPLPTRKGRKVADVQ